MRISQTVTKLWGIQERLEKRNKSRGHSLKSNKSGNNEACAPQIIFN